MLKEAGIAGLIDLHLAHHLTHNNLEVLVVDFHTLEAIDILHLVNDVFLHCRRTLDSQDVGRSDSTVAEGGTGTHKVILLHQNLLTGGDKVTLDIARFGSDDNLAVTTLELAHGDLTVDFANNSWIRRVTCLKELCDTGQTARDITSLTLSTWNLHHNVTRLDHLVGLDHHVAAHRQVVSADDHVILIEYFSGRHLATILGLSDYNFTETC